MRHNAMMVAGTGGLTIVLFQFQVSPEKGYERGQILFSTSASSCSRVGVGVNYNELGSVVVLVAVAV
ncbi:hypothetical protein U1Q18_050437, partial [Sarracenia purpurea var. burkii]